MAADKATSGDAPRLARALDHRFGAPIPSIESALAGVAASYPSGRMGQPNDVAGVVAFLLSDAARFVNGVEIPVDDGFTAKAQ